MQQTYLNEKAAPAPTYPIAPLFRLDVLWFQVAGTLCNLQCQHCLLSAGPANATHKLMTLDEIKPVLIQARMFDVKEFYFTGGEPFMNRELPEILEETLKFGPATVLTNGTLITSVLAEKMGQMIRGAEHPLDIRISLDGTTEASNDRIRGKGSFQRILRGIRNLVEAGFNPVITFTKAMVELEGGTKNLDSFLDLLKSLGIQKPRLKILDLFRIGREVNRGRAYRPRESLSGTNLSDCELSRLECTGSRVVTHEGVSVCPILVCEPSGYLGKSFYNALRPFELTHPACYTCVTEGATCRTEPH